MSAIIEAAKAIQSEPVRYLSDADRAARRVLITLRTLPPSVLARVAEGWDDDATIGQVWTECVDAILEGL